MFLGTPHRGADLAGILNLVLLASFSSRSFVKQLRPNSDAIASINNGFVHRVEPLKLISFFETENTRLRWVRPFQILANRLVGPSRENDRSRNVGNFGLPEREQTWFEWGSHRNRQIHLKERPKLCHCFRRTPKTGFRDCQGGRDVIRSSVEPEEMQNC